MSRHILLITDDASDAAIVEKALLDSTDETFQVEWVRTCGGGVARLDREGEASGASDTLAAILVDLRLPDCQGIDTLDRLFIASRHIPILVLSEIEDEALGKRAVQGGAQDYLVKARLDSYLLPKALRNMIERAAITEALFDEKELAQVTLNCIGDAVLRTDARGYVTYLNVVAEKMTGWMRDEAAGHPFQEICRVIDSTGREIDNPMQLAVRENRPVGLAPDCVLVRRDGTQVAIEDSIAPIHDRRGRVRGAVMVFRDGVARRLAQDILFSSARQPHRLA